MSLLQNSYMFANLLINYLLSLYYNSNSFYTQNNEILIDHSWKPYSQSKIYNPCTYHYEVLDINYQQDINLNLSIKFILYVIVLPLSSFFLIGTENVILFCDFPQTFTLILKFFCQLFDYKMIIVCRTIMKYCWNFFWRFLS